MFGPDKQWGDVPPYRQLGLDALDAASADFALGNQGAGYGATTGTVKGGLAARPPCSRALRLAHSWPPTRSEPASTRAPATFGHARLSLMGSSALHPRHLIRPAALDPHGRQQACRRAAGANTTIAIVATDAALTRAEASRIAIMAHDGMARAVRPVHTPFDGDTVFALATGAVDPGDNRPATLAMLGSLAADCLARAIGRAVAQAATLHGVAAWQEPPESA
jgi:L-aminopeptidase/D-esterase-like protein